MVNKKARYNTVLIVMDIVGFILILVGSGLIRYSRDEITAILGGFVMAGGVTILGITRYVQK